MDGDVEKTTFKENWINFHLFLLRLSQNLTRTRSGAYKYDPAGKLPENLLEKSNRLKNCIVKTNFNLKSFINFKQPVPVVSCVSLSQKTVCADTITPYLLPLTSLVQTLPTFTDD